MGTAGRSTWLKYLALALVWSLLRVGVASAAEVSALGEPGSSPLSSPLVVPEVNQLLEGQPAREAEEARRASPEAVVARTESETRYEALNGENAAKLVNTTFPALLDQSAGGLPPLPPGASVTGFPSIYAAQVDFGQGHHGVIDSLEPLAVEQSPGHRIPVVLGLHEVNGAFEPASPLVAVRIAKQVSGGVTLAPNDVSLTPVDSRGVPLGGAEGVVDGSSIFFANTQEDEDTVVKPSTFGFDVSAILRSVNSPSAVFYRVGMPEGASLVQQKESGAVQVIKEGVAIATIVLPVAQDATGASVPVSMSGSGDVLTVEAKMSTGEFEYPIRLDPEVIDESRSYQPGVWAFYTDDSKGFEGSYSEGYNETEGKRTYFSGPTDSGLWTETFYNGDYGYFVYNTQGSSRIYAFVASVNEDQSGYLIDEIALRKSNGEIEKGNGEGGYTKLEFNSDVREWTGLTICSSSTCSPQPVAGSENNGAYFKQKVYGEFKGGFQFMLSSSKVEIEQEKAPTASFDTSDPTIEGQPNALLSGKWYKSTSNVTFGIDAYDPGIGIFKQGLSSPAKSGWGYTLKNETRNGCEGVQCNECYEPSCTAKASGTGKPLTYSLTSAAGGELPEGEDTVEGKVEDAAGLSATAVGKIKIDNAPPTITSFSGLPSSHELVDGQHVLLKASAKSGLAGIASIVLDVDGQQIGGSQGSCSGACTGHAEWTLSDNNYAAGEHTLTVIAEDNAGNIAKEEYHMVIHHAGYVAVGPGSVDPITGEFELGATDVSVAVPDGGLTVTRNYRSQHLALGAEGPLGPQWSLDLGSQQSLSRISGGMILTNATGGQVVFESTGSGEFKSPPGDAGLLLSEKIKEGKTIFTLSENGSTTTFELPVGSSGSVWMPSSAEGPNGTSMTLYKFKLVSGVIEPTEELAPVPAGVSCGKEVSELKEGCRALQFEYREGSTTARGEKASEWGEYTGHLSKVRYIAWSASKTKTEKVIAEYAYDAKGRLRAEWNPQIRLPPLKTTYGYDLEGHVTAVSTSGHEPELLEQGTIPSDVSPGRLLAVAVPSAATALGSGEAPSIKEVPTLSSTTPVVGTKISVNLTSEKTPGTWTGSPLAFIYQWEDCNSAGKECSPIPGAVNQSYYPVAGDEGHTLVAQATALNATGAVTAETLATSTVGAGTPNTPLPEPPSVGSDAVTTLEYQVPVYGSGAPNEMTSTELAKWGQSDDPNEAMTIFSPEKVMGWPAKEYKEDTVYYLDGKDRVVNTALPTGGISTAEYNLYNDVIRTLSPDDRLKAITEGCKTKEECKSATENTYEEKGSEPGTELLSTLGPQHTVKLAIGKEGKINEEALAREHTNYYYNEGAPTEGGPYHLVTKTIDSAETASKEQFDKRTTTTSYSGQEVVGWKLRKPTSVTTDPGGLNLVHTTLYEAKTGNVIETRMPAAGKGSAPSYSLSFGKEGTGHGEFKWPVAIAIDSSGNIWVTDTVRDVIQEFNAKHEYVRQFGMGGSKESDEFSEPEGIATNSAGDVYVADTKNDRVQEFSPEGKFVRMFGFGVSNGEKKAEICTSSCHEGLSGTGEGQFNSPHGIVVDSSGNVWVVDSSNDRVEEFNEKGEYLKKFGSAGTGESQFKHPTGITISGGNLYVVDEENDRVEEFSTSGTDAELGHFGKTGSGNGEFLDPNWIATEPKSGNLYVVDWDHDRVEELTASGTWVATFGSEGHGEGQFTAPKGVAVDGSGDVYVIDRGDNRVEEWAHGATGNEGAHDTKTIYYTTAANSEYTECGERPAMANLPCETAPAAQPGTSGLPELATTRYTYNIWDEPETTVEKVGSTTRTKTDSYDEAGRPKTAAISSTVGEPVPTVTDEYNKETGALEKQCQNTGKPCTEGKPKMVTSVYNKLGQLEGYTDANENTTSYEYEKEKGSRLKTINDKEGTETIEYNETSGLVNGLTYTNGLTKMTFGATYDAEGNMLTETYPNGMTATYTYNQVGKPTSLVYNKTTHCTEEEKEKCKWFKDTIIPSIHGQWIEQTSTLSHQAYTYTYDNAGRLTQVQNTPVGKDCTTRIYAYDEDGNRTSLVTRESSTETCATEGGKTQEHTYDTADRLTDPGIAYNTFGDITTLPAADAEPSAEHALTSTYYTDSQVASQKQNEQTVDYNLDPAGRTLETISTGKPNNSTIISHYAGPGNTPAWTINSVSSEWRRNITGINGSLVGIQNNGETPELQLSNLHGDIIAKAYLSETATELAGKADTSEFGVPTVAAPAKYAWLGASELPTELPSGVVTMGVRSYVPQIGRFLQPDPVPGGSADAYAYTFGDPVNSSDPTGEYTNTASATVLKQMQLEGEGIAASGLAKHERERREAEEQYAAEQAARAAAEAAAEAADAAGPQYEESGEEWEEWEEGGEEWEYAAYHEGSKADGEKAHVEPGLLYQPIEEGTSGEHSEDGESEGVGHYRDVSGDGCGDGGYCGGHWVKKSGHGHRRGEPIGGSPWEPLDGFCIAVGWANPFTGYTCGAYGVVREATR
jgi:RHS repeat-associated protein